MAEWVLKGSIRGPAGEIPDVSSFLALNSAGNLIQNGVGVQSFSVGNTTSEPDVIVKRTVDSVPCEALFRIDSEAVAGIRFKVNGQIVNNLYLEQTKTRFSKPLDVASGGVPQDGSVGQVLTKGANGAMWATPTSSSSEYQTPSCVPVTVENFDFVSLNVTLKLADSYWWLLNYMGESEILIPQGTILIDIAAMSSDDNADPANFYMFFTASDIYFLYNDVDEVYIAENISLGGEIFYQEIRCHKTASTADFKAYMGIS